LRFRAKVLCVLFALTVTASDVNAASLSEAQKTKVDEIAVAWIASEKTPGMVVGIASDGKMLHAKGYGSGDHATGGTEKAQPRRPHREILSGLPARQ
jgi:CubicO group peptidase (beta-lactamase class C family)